jgi:hypothetical protein
MTFFLDLWHDLREKRLWPVAVGLVAAAAAIPAIMLKPAAQPSDPPVVAVKDNNAATLPAVNVDTAPTHGSKLETFSKRNPFKPLADLQKEPGTTAGDNSSSTGGSAGGGSAGTGSNDGGAPAGGSSGGSGGSSPDTSTPGSSPNPSSGNPTSPGLHWFKMTADFQFGLSGKPKTMKSVEPLTLLPDSSTPVIVFMGVASDAKSATFFIADPAYTADGEGTCNDREHCEFVTLRLSEGHNEETFTDGQVAYDLKLTKLRREPISAAEAKGDSVDSTPKSKHAGPTAGKTIADTSARFLPRLMTGPDPAATTK